MQQHFIAKWIVWDGSLCFTGAKGENEMDCVLRERPWVILHPQSGALGLLPI